MKPLDQLNIVERAKLLHDLFPECIPEFIEYAKRLASYTEDNAETIRKNWKEQLFGFDLWLGYARDAKNRIEKQNSKLVKSSRLFSDQLFDGYLAFWTADAINKYVDEKMFPHGKFRKMVQILFSS